MKSILFFHFLLFSIFCLAQSSTNDIDAEIAIEAKNGNEYLYKFKNGTRVYFIKKTADTYWVKHRGENLWHFKNNKETKYIGYKIIAVKYDCVNAETGLKAMYYYNSDGDLIDSDIFSFGEITMVPVVPESNGAIEIEKVCSL